FWLKRACSLGEVTLWPMPGDASFRQYYRIFSNGNSYVVMDAPPPQENCQSFFAIANGLRDLGLNTPQIFYAGLKEGFLLLSDFGDMTYLKALNGTNAHPLYECALNALCI